MTESVARLRGEQLTLGYGKYTVAENLTVEYLMVTSRQLVGPKWLTVNPRYCVP